MNFLAEVWQSFKSTVRGFDSPHQLALGITMGVMIGLLPKDSLLPYLLGALAILSPGNLLCLFVGLGAGSLIGPHCDPVTHRIGESILTYQPLGSIWATLYDLPLMPWFRFENTVVMGSLALGLIAALPVYFISRKLCELFGPQIYHAIANHRWMRRWSEASPQPLES